MAVRVTTDNGNSGCAVAVGFAETGRKDGESPRQLQLRDGNPG